MRTRAMRGTACRCTAAVCSCSSMPSCQTAAQWTSPTTTKRSKFLGCHMPPDVSLCDVDVMSVSRLRTNEL